MPAPRWDLFCTVVDNYGDAGVCWRLARQLAAEHAVDVRLWIDQPSVLQRLAPAVSPATDTRRIAGVEIQHWTNPFPQADPADVVVETFGCELPAAYVEAMAQAQTPPVWINLDYLSAENWVEGCHGLPSPHPRLPLTKYFFFPGFTPRTGGLLRERGLAAERRAFQADARALAAFWEAIGAAPAPDALRVSLFCYEHAPVPALLDAWAGGPDPVACLAPARVATRALETWFRTPIVAGRPLRAKQLTLHPVPFLDQASYDRLLWACDVNFVRGEDSFVRAQFAARPFAWNIYPQAQAAHRLKLDAFLARYLPGVAEGPANALRAFTRAWNGDGAPGPAWQLLVRELPALRTHADRWADGLSAQPGLADALVRFVRERVKSRSFQKTQAKGP
jgi:uncharacterized repeat protein (TIGR03837 family)